MGGTGFVRVLMTRLVEFIIPTLVVSGIAMLGKPRGTVSQSGGGSSWGGLLVCRADQLQVFALTNLVFKDSLGTVF